MINWTISVGLPLLLLLSVLLVMKKVVESRKPLPPGPAGLPIIGNMHQLGALPHQSLWKLSMKYGPVMGMQLGRVPLVVVSSPEAARQVLKVHDIDCCSKPRLLGTGKLSYNYIDIAFAPFGDYWREMRRIRVLELFSTKRVQSFRFVREEEVASLVDSISQSASLKTPVDLSEKLLFLTANIIWRIAFGGSTFKDSKWDVGTIYQKTSEAVAVMGCFAASDFFPYVGWIVDRLTGHHSRLERIFRDLDDLLQQAVDDHLNRNPEEGKEDIIDVLLRIEKEQVETGAANQLTKNHIKAILSDVFLAGIDTAEITMVWVMAELVRNPRVMKKLQAEIRDHMGKKGNVSEDDIEQLAYLDIVLKETWRLHPPGPLLIPREVMSPFKINGYNIYPKTRIQVNVWAIGRDPNTWKDPEEFIPERFADSQIDFKGQHFELLPFGAGRRGCPGINMGTTLVKLALSNLLYHFDWELPEGVKVEEINRDESPGLTVHKKDHLELVPVNYRWT